MFCFTFITLSKTISLIISFTISLTIFTIKCAFTCNRIFKNTYFEKDLRRAASDSSYILYKKLSKIYSGTRLAFCFIVKYIITVFYLLSFVFICFINRGHALSLIVIFYYALSLVSFIVTRCHSLSFVVPLVVIRCTTRQHSLYHALSFVVTRCTTRSQPLSLVGPLACLFINDPCGQAKRYSSYH